MIDRRDPYAEVGAATRLAIDRAMSGLTLPEARVMLALVGRLTAWSLVADRVALGQLVETTGMDDRAVRRAVRSLEARGAIGYQPGSSPPGGRRVSSRFALPSADARPGVTQTPGRTDRGSTRPHTGGHTDPRNRGSTRPPSRELREDSPEDNTRAASDQLEPTLAAANGDGAFDRFWSLWPRKVAKPAARKAWRAARRKAPGDVIVDAAQRHAAGYAGTDQRYVPHPATWLNQERWNDPPPSATNRSNGRGGFTAASAAGAEAIARQVMGLDS